jgi:hypothetical protein
VNLALNEMIMLAQRYSTRNWTQGEVRLADAPWIKKQFNQ